MTKPKPTSIETPMHFFMEVLSPNWQDFQEHQDIRRAMNFSTTALAMRDWCYEAGVPFSDIGNYTDHLVKDRPLVQLCFEVANASKHSVLRALKGPSRRMRQIDSAESIGLCMMTCNDPCNTALQTVRIDAKEGDVLFARVAEATMVLWMSELGITPRFP